METLHTASHNRDLPVGGYPHFSTRYFVATGNGGGWLVFKEGIQRPLRRMSEKLQAVETARIMAREDAPSQVLVERTDGSFFQQYAFSSGGHMH